MAEDQSFQFEGFESPNFTPTPDALFDVLLARISDAELRVLLYIIRRTFGFKKDSDTISLKQMTEGITTREGKRLDLGAGLSKASAARGIKGLIDKGIVLAQRNQSRERGDEPTTYRLRFRDPVFNPETGGTSVLRHGGTMDLRQGGVSQRDTQETDSQETVKQETEVDLSSPRKTDKFSKNGHVYDEVRLTLVEYVADLSAEFIDIASVESSTTRTTNLFHRAGLPLEQFIDIMTEARAVTKERMASIKKRTKEGDKTKMAYFFSVLEDKLGLREHQGGAA
jgi:hypothetical protein